MSTATEKGAASLEQGKRWFEGTEGCWVNRTETVQKLRVENLLQWLDESKQGIPQVRSY